MAPVQNDPIWRHDAPFGGQQPAGESREALRSGVRQTQGEAELLGQVQEDVEELRLELDGIEVGVEMAHVESPVDSAFELGPALPADLVQVGMVPQVGRRPREAAVAVEQGRGLGDRSPTVQVVLGIESEPDADVLTPVLRRGAVAPRAAGTIKVAVVAVTVRSAS